ncbi:Cif family virulence factor [Aquimarina sp. M1]
MEKSINRLFLIFSFWIGTLGLVAQGVLINRKNTSAYLSKFTKDYNTGMRTANPKLITSYYSQDVRLMPAFQKTLLGSKNASIYYKAFFERFDIVEYNRKPIETLDLGIQLCVLGEFIMKVQLKNTTTVEELRGKYMNIWKKGKNNLSLLSEIWNYNHHTDLTEQLKFDKVPGTVIAYQGHLPIDNNIRFELAALNEFMEEFISQGDHTLWSQLYASDAVAMFSYQPIYEDKKSLEVFIKNHVAELPIFEKLDIRNNHVDDLETYIVNYASHIANWRNDNYSGISTGKGIKIWRREPNGSLKIVRQIATYDYNY